MSTVEETEAEPEEGAESDGFVDRDIGFEFIIERGHLDAFLDAIEAVSDECVLKVKEGGIHVRLVDAANVLMMDGTLDADAFEFYDATRTRIGIPVGRLKEAISFAGKNDPVQISLNEENRKLLVELEDAELEVAGIDPDSIRNEPDLPDLDLALHATIKSDQLKRALSIAEFVNETGGLAISYDTTLEELSFQSPGDKDTGELTLDAEDLVELDASGDAHSIYSVDFLQRFIPPMPKDTPVSIEVGVEHPLMAEHEAVDGHCRALYVLAPRIQSE